MEPSTLTSRQRVDHWSERFAVQLVIAAGAIVIIVSLFLLMFMTLWVLSRLEHQTRGWPFILHNVNDVAVYLRDRNLDLIRQVYSAGYTVLHWADDEIHAAIAAITSVVIGPLNGLLAIIYDEVKFIQTGSLPYLDGAIKNLQLSEQAIISNRIIPLESVVRLATTAIGQLVSVTIPGLSKLIADTSALLNATIINTIVPMAQQVLGIENYIQKTLAPDLAHTESVANGAATTIGLTITKPVTGLLDRTGVIEKELGQILPWATAIGLSLPIAQTLSKLGKNPCYCMTDGGLQDNGDLELAILMDLI